MSAIKLETLFHGVAALRDDIRARLARFDRDEDGLSTVEMILLLFIGVVIIVAILSFFWDSIWPRVEQIVNDLFQTADQGGNQP